MVLRPQVESPLLITDEPRPGPGAEIDVPRQKLIDALGRVIGDGVAAAVRVREGPVCAANG